MCMVSNSFEISLKGACIKYLYPRYFLFSNLDPPLRISDAQLRRSWAGFLLPAQNPISVHQLY